MVRDPCFAVQDLLREYLAGTVQPETAEWMEEHLLTCPVCAGKKEALEKRGSGTRRRKAKVQPAGDEKPDAEQGPATDDAVSRRLLRQFNRMHIGLLLMALMIFLHLLPWMNYGGDAIWFLQYTLPGMFITLFVLAFPRYNLSGAVLGTLVLLMLPMGACEILRHPVQYAGELGTLALTRNYWMMLGAALLLTGMTLVHIWRGLLWSGIRSCIRVKEK